MIDYLGLIELSLSSGLSPNSGTEAIDGAGSYIVHLVSHCPWSLTPSFLPATPDDIQGTMAIRTRDVLFAFMCSEDMTLRHMHALPESLIVQAPFARSIPGYHQLFVEAVCRITLQRHDECFAAVPRKTCMACDKAAKFVLTTPMSWLHLDPPRIGVLVNPVCEDPQCEREARARIQEFVLKDTADMADAAARATGRVPTSRRPDNSIAELIPCGLCGTVENTLKCSGCDVVGYCNEVGSSRGHAAVTPSHTLQEHQRAHWNVHKAMCRSSQ